MLFIYVHSSLKLITRLKVNDNAFKYIQQSRSRYSRSRRNFLIRIALLLCGVFFLLFFLIKIIPRKKIRRCGNINRFAVNERRRRKKNTRVRARERERESVILLREVINVITNFQGCVA